MLIRETPISNLDLIYSKFKAITASKFVLHHEVIGEIFIIPSSGYKFDRKFSMSFDD